MSQLLALVPTLRLQNNLVTTWQSLGLGWHTQLAANIPTLRPALSALIVLLTINRRSCTFMEKARAGFVKPMDRMQH